MLHHPSTKVPITFKDHHIQKFRNETLSTRPLNQSRLFENPQLMLALTRLTESRKSSSVANLEKKRPKEQAV